MNRNKYIINYLPSNIDDLSSILKYISHDLKNPRAAKRLLDKVNKSISSRSYNPQSFEKYNRLRFSKFLWYRIYVDNYVIFYTVTENTINLARILSNRQNFSSLL